MTAEATHKKFKYVVLFSLITLSSAIIVFILILVNQFGSFNVMARHDNPFVRPKIAMLLSDYNLNYYKSENLNYQEIIDQWYSVLKELNATPALIRDRDLENGNKLDSDILVLPSTVCLSDKQISMLKKFAKNGGGIILSWAAGTRREGGSWRDWEFLEEIASLKVIKMDKQVPIPMPFMTVNSNSPVTAGIPSGLLINLMTDVAELLARSDNVDAFYSEHNLYPIITEKGFPPYSAITHSEYGKGKVMWTGFNINRLLLNRDNKFFLRKLVSNTINWMLNYPQGSIDNWPYGHKAAFLVDQDTEHEHKNTDNLVKVLVEEKVPGTFFCISQIFEKDPQYLKKLPSDLIEIGSHLDTAETLQNQSYSTQLERIKRSKEALERLSGQKVVGLKPAEEIFDNNTIKVLMNLGFKYMIGNPKTTLAVPTIINLESIPKDVVRLEHLLEPPKGDFVLFSRIARDDYHIMVDKKILKTNEILAILKADFHNIYNLGGIYIYALHTQLLSADPYKEVSSDFIKYAKNYKVWFAKGKDFAKWWLERSNIEQRITSFDSGGFTVSLSSKNRQSTIKDIGLTYYLGKNPKKIDVGASGGNEKLNYVYDEKTKSINIKIDSLEPQSKRKIKISLD